MVNTYSINRLLPAKSVHVAEKQFSVIRPKMHPASEAIFEKPAVAALVFPHPRPVAVRLETVFPHVHEIVLVDIALMIIAPDARTRRNRAVGKYRSD